MVVLGLAATLIGLLVYATERDLSRSVLIPAFLALDATTHPLSAVSGSLPSFVHPFAFSLFTVVALPRQSPLRYWACAAWALVNVTFELGQHPAMRRPLSDGIHRIAGQRGLADTLARYFTSGSFDVHDVLAACAGGSAAALVLLVLQKREGRIHV